MVVEAGLINGLCFGFEYMPVPQDLWAEIGHTNMISIHFFILRLAIFY